MRTGFVRSLALLGALGLFGFAPRVEAVLEFPLSGSRLPGGLTVGPDGALWFVEDDRIGRICTGGVITELAVGMVSYPQAIVAGPDGNLWITESGNNHLARMT